MTYLYKIGVRLNKLVQPGILTSTFDHICCIEFELAYSCVEQPVL